jgi:hypothetical protein
VQRGRLERIATVVILRAALVGDSRAGDARSGRSAPDAEVSSAAREPGWRAPIADRLSDSAGKVEHTISIPPLVSTMKAQLQISSEDLWAKERGGPTVTRVVWNGKEYDEPAVRKNRPSFSLPADERAVQRLVIDGVPVLLHVLAGEKIQFQSNPCSGWLLASPRLDMYAGGTGLVRFRSTGEGAVSVGYYQDSAFKETRRVRLSSRTTTQYYPVRFNHCRFAAFKLGKEVIVAMRNDEKWTVTVFPDGSFSAIVDR